MLAGLARRLHGVPHALWLALAVALCYANSLAVPFLLDDPRPEEALVYRTRPLVAASFALNRWLGGASPWSYHALNVLVHLGCGLLLLGLLRRTIPRVAPDLAPGTQHGLALATVLLWSCHPLQTEAVTYLSQRAESLGAFFYLACLYAFVRSTSAPRPLPWQALALLALALGFLSKETIATAPLTLLLYDATFLERGPLRALERRSRFYQALFLVAGVLFIVFISFLLFERDSTVGFRLAQSGPLQYLRTQAGVILHYLRLAFWPHPLVFDYGWPLAAAPREYLPQSIAVGALLLAAGVLVARRSWIGFALAWFFVILVPSSSIVPIKDAAFEHRVYLSLAGVLVLVVVGGWALGRRLPGRARILPRGLVAVLVLALCAGTIRRNREYRTALGLWQTVVERAPRSTRGRLHLAAALKEEGRHDQAIAVLESLIGLDPTHHGAHHNLGSAYLARGDPARAVECFEKAIALFDSAAYRAGLATALFARGDHAEAQDHFRKAVVLDPTKGSYRLGLANALTKLGRPDEAIAEYREALRLEPELQEAHTNLAALLSSQGRAEEALAHYQRALAILPNSAEEHYNHGQCLLALGRFGGALNAFHEALRLSPGLAEPYAALARTLCSKGDASPEERAEALRLARKANEMTGSRRADVLETLALVQAANGDFAGAVARIEEALVLPGPTKNPSFRERLLAQQERYRREER